MAGLMTRAFGNRGLADASVAFFDILNKDGLEQLAGMLARHFAGCLNDVLQQTNIIRSIRLTGLFHFFQTCLQGSHRRP